MGLMIHGDDELIKHLKGMTYILRFLLILVVIAFGLFTIDPKTNGDVNCSFVRHPLWSNKFFSVNVPVPPLKCHA